MGKTKETFGSSRMVEKRGIESVRTKNGVQLILRTTASSASCTVSGVATAKRAGRHPGITQVDVVMQPCEPLQGEPSRLSSASRRLLL